MIKAVAMQEEGGSLAGLGSGEPPLTPREIKVHKKVNKSLLTGCIIMLDVS